MHWQELNKWIEKFESRGLSSVLDFEQFNRIAIVHHSSAIEGSTLTFEETALLITEGITAKGKSMSEHEMVKDHYHALLFVLENAKNKTAVTPEFLKQINARVNKNTGQVRNTLLGICDDTKGDFRLGNVTAGTTYFVNYDKVTGMAAELCEKIQSKITTAKTTKEIYGLSFDAHFYLVSIHPWFDGNGRTSRLLMNFIQAFHHKPLSIVFLEDKSTYIKVLNDARRADDPDIFRKFMTEQHINYMKQEIERYEQRNKGIRFLL
ncbi:MAG: Fic family protein [Bacteroidetes bacterium]|nr:Fic family protein [Bacteroidota bacterium]